KTGADVYEGLIVGSVVVVAVAFTQLRQASRRGKRFLAGPLGIVMAINLSLLAGVLAALLAPKTPLGGGTLILVTTALTVFVFILLRFLEGRRGVQALAAPPPLDQKPTA